MGANPAAGPQGREEHRGAPRLAGMLLAAWVLVYATAVLFRLLGDPATRIEEGTDPWGSAYLIFVYPAVFFAFALVGALIVSRTSSNLVGWVCVAVGLCAMVADAAAAYGAYALEARAGSLPAGEFAAWLGGWIWVPSLVLIGTFLMLLFPDGRLPSRRWRPVAWLSAAVLVLSSFSEALFPGALSGVPVDAGASTEGVPSALGLVVVVLLPTSFVASALSVLARFRRSGGGERQQIKWFAAAATLLAVAFPVALVAASGVLEDLATLAFAGLPLAVGIAVLRYRLYDIDLIVNRAIVYALLTASLALVYFGSVTAAQAVLRALADQESTLAVVASTLAIAALFNPLRRGLQASVDRLFYRSRYDAAKTLESFSATLRDEVGLDELSNDLMDVLSVTVRPAHATLWLRPPPGKWDSAGGHSDGR